MDRSVDSIGSCSLDVDADSTDFSDTSGELNFLTPSSAKDITKEFTAGIKERCKIPLINCQSVATVLDPITGNINTVLTSTTSPQSTEAVVKKPSYLNLACCVNGYSNLTTYDSKLRQDINKSREVSPSRPIIATLHYNRSEGNTFLTAPNLSYISMNNNNSNSNNRNIIKMSKKEGGQDVTDNVVFNGNGVGGALKNKVLYSSVSAENNLEKFSKKSFIQQRVEKLYGSMEGVVINKQISHNNERKYLNNIANSQNNQNEVIVDENNKEILEASIESLPVLRHLRPEFRAQLQIFSPKKLPKSPPNSNHNLIPNGKNEENLMSNGNTNNHHYSNGSFNNNTNANNNNSNSIPQQYGDNKVVIESKINDITLVNTTKKSTTPIVNVAIVANSNSSVATENINIINNNNCDSTNCKITEKSLENMNLTDGNGDENNKENHEKSIVVKDGNYFLNVLKNEQNRLITMAIKIEHELEQLTNDGVEIGEEMSGHLRSASGKARLLATQKMKQFEGLCYNNLNQLPDEKFQTTKEDLQGFWDMVMLQVVHVDSLFQEIEMFKTNGWTKPVPTSPTPQVRNKSTKLVKRPYKSPPTANGTANSSTNSSDSKKSATAAAAAQRREAQRKQLMEMKRKQKLANNQQDVEIFAPPSALDIVNAS